MQMIMPFRYVENTGVAISLEAWGRSLEEMVLASADATVHLMVGDIEALSRDEQMTLTATGVTESILLVEVLREILFQKNTNGILLRLHSGKIIRNKIIAFSGAAFGEALEENPWRIKVNVTALHTHLLSIERSGQRWKARIVLKVD